MFYLPPVLIVIALCASYLLGWTPPIVSITYLAMSLVTFLVYARDKSAAIQGQWRVSEGTLHFFSFLGGWPGGIVAQQVLRHKTKKTSFRIQFWVTVFLNTAGLAYLHTNRGYSQLNHYVVESEIWVMGNVQSDVAQAIVHNLLCYHSGS